jgi:hypothetical protein
MLYAIFRLQADEPPTAGALRVERSPDSAA